MPDLSQININVTDTIPPENFATIDKNAMVGTVYTKAQENEWRAEVETIVTTGIKGVLKPNTAYDPINNPYPTPWVAGDSNLFEIYVVNESGTFINTKDVNDEYIVVTPLELELNEVQIWIKNGISTLHKKAMPQAIQSIIPFADSTFPLVAPASPLPPIQRTHDDSIWQLAEGETALSTDVPGVSDVWIEITSLKYLFNPFFEINDIDGNTCFRIDGEGKMDVAKFNNDTIQRIKDILGFDFNINSFAVLADSISTDNGGNPAEGLVQSDIWWYKVAQDLNCTTYINAVAGSCIATGGGGEIDMSDDSRLNSVIASDPDVVFIFGGINDFGQDIPISTFGSVDKTNFHGGLRYIYTSLMTGLPNARIFHITPLHMNYVPYTTAKPEYNGQNYLTDYIDAIKQEAQAFGVSVIDANKNSGITQYNIDNYASDGIHGNAAFHTLIKNCVIRELENLI